MATNMYLLPPSGPSSKPRTATVQVKRKVTVPQNVKTVTKPIYVKDLTVGSFWKTTFGDGEIVDIRITKPTRHYGNAVKTWMVKLSDGTLQKGLKKPNFLGPIAPVLKATATQEETTITELRALLQEGLNKHLSGWQVLIDGQESNGKQFVVAAPTGLYEKMRNMHVVGDTLDKILADYAPET